MATTQVEMKNFVRFSDLAEEPLATLPPISGYEQMPLVTLEAAIKPLLAIVPDVKRMFDMIEINSDEIQDNLSWNESASIRLYSMQWQPKEQSFNLLLNRTLRDENREKLKPWYLYLKLFMHSLIKLPSTHCYVYRAIGNDLSDEYPQEEHFSGGDLLYVLDRLNSSKRSRISIKSINEQDLKSSVNPAKTFAIIPQCYRVVSTLDSGDGLHIIQLKEIDPHVIVPLNGNERISSVNLALTPRNSLSNLYMQNPSFYSVVLQLTGTGSSNYHNPHLEDLLSLSKSNSLINLSVRELTDQDMSIVVQRALIDKKCKSLYLTGNYLCNQSLSILSDALYNNLTLVELDLSDNYISDLGVQILMDVLRTNKSILQKLHLGSNQISDQGMPCLSEMLKTNHTLTHLMLNRNYISNHGVLLLADVLALHNISLQVLSLSSNHLITDACVESLIIMLKHNETLKGLDLKCCNLSEMSNQRLQRIIAGKHGFQLFTTTNENRCFVS